MSLFALFENVSICKSKFYETGVMYSINISSCVIWSVCEASLSCAARAQGRAPEGSLLLPHPS